MHVLQDMYARANHDLHANQFVRSNQKWTHTPLHSVMKQMVLSTLQVLTCMNSSHFTLNTCKDAF